MSSYCQSQTPRVSSANINPPPGIAQARAVIHQMCKHPGSDPAKGFQDTRTMETLIGFDKFVSADPQSAYVTPRIPANSAQIGGESDISRDPKSWIAKGLPYSMYNEQGVVRSGLEPMHTSSMEAIQAHNPPPLQNVVFPEWSGVSPEQSLRKYLDSGIYGSVTLPDSSSEIKKRKETFGRPSQKQDMSNFTVVENGNTKLSRRPRLSALEESRVSFAPFVPRAEFPPNEQNGYCPPEHVSFP